MRRIEATTPYEKLPTLLTIEEAAIYTGYSKKYLANAFSSGRFPITAKRVGKNWRVPKHQFDTSIKQTFR